MIALDFETYYDNTLNVTELGPRRYAHDLILNNKPPYLISLASPGGLTYVGPLSSCPWKKFYPSNGIVAHNASFDKVIFQACAEAGLVPAEWSRVPWFCTADMSAYLNAPRNLQGAVKCLLGVDISKDLRSRMKGRLFDSLSAKDRMDMENYALRDATLCLALWEKFSGEWPEFERKVSEINREAGIYGVAINESLIREFKATLSHAMFRAEQILPWRNGEAGSESKILSPKALAEACRRNGIPCPENTNEDSPECEAWEATYSEKFPWVKAMREYRKANILLKKLATMEKQSIDGVLPFNLLYFGAHTGRFSGSNRMNMQNLPGRKASETPLRKVIVPRKDNLLCVIDWAQIEPRILYWMVKDTESLSALRDGAQIYELYARRHMGYSDPEPLKEKNPQLYVAAKAAVLGLGYGCGAKRYVSVAKSLAGLELTPEESVSQVQQYRGSNPRIVAMWSQLIFQARIHASRHEDYHLQLPSGRVLHYYKLSSIRNEKGDGLRAEVCLDGSKITFLHGGRITENWVQATARDVFAVGLTRLHEAGFRNLFHVHDEYVLEIPNSSDRADVEKRLREILLAPIPWLPDCPLDISIDWGDSYD